MSDEERENIIERAISTEGRSLENESLEVRNDRDLIMEILRRTFDRGKKVYLTYIGNDLKDDEELFILAIKIEADNMQFASRNLKNDKDTCIATMKENYNMLTGFEGDEIRNDYDFMAKLVREYNWENVKYASEKLRNDEDFMRNALRQSSKAKDYIGDRLRQNESFMNDVEKY